MKGKWRKRLIVAASAFFAGLLMSAGLPELVADIQGISVYASGDNVVAFESTKVEAEDSGLIAAKIVATGANKQQVTVTYRTRSGTAVQDVDYQGAYNSVTLTIGSSGNPSGTASYTIGIQSLVTTDTREKLRVVDNDGMHGRYFHLDIIAVENGVADPEKDSCACYLPYDYKVSATTGVQDESVMGREIAYINDYAEMISKYHKGDGDISGKEHWRTWNEGISFDSDITKRWVTTYINRGFAEAYGSYILKSIDDDKVHSESNIYLLSGNKEFMDKYKKDKDDFDDIPGKSLYYEIEPCTSGGYRLDGKAMLYISQDKNPYGQDHDLVDLEKLHVCGPHIQRYWIPNEDCWYSRKGSIYDSVFYKTAPYNGVLDYGLSIFNNNKSWDREVHDIWMFLALVDLKNPTIESEYTEINPVTGGLRIFLRFNEPVYSSYKGNSFLTVNLNNDRINKYYADYVEGNYTDTLVYEIPADSVPKTLIERVDYTLPNDDIGDLAFNLDVYRKILNNKVQNPDQQRAATITEGTINLGRPQIALSPTGTAESMTPAPSNILDVMVSANGNGATTFDTGTVYYQWDKNSYIADPDNPTSYANSHVLTSEERASFNVTLTKNDAQGIDSGIYYLHVLAVSKYGMSAKMTSGKYLLDGDAPEVTQLSPSPDELQNKTYRLRVADKAVAGSGAINTLTMAVKYVDTAGVETLSKNQLIANGGVTSDFTNFVTMVPDDGFTEIRYKANIDADYPLDPIFPQAMGARAQMEAEIYFELVDKAGNKVTSSSIRSIYDRRTLFENVVTSPASYVEDTSIADLGAPVFDIQNAGTEDGLRFEIADPEPPAEPWKKLIDDGAKYSVLLNGKDSYSANDGDYAVILKNLGPGYYEAQGRITGTAGTTAVDLVSRTYFFYLTNGKNDETINKTNASGNLVLSNRVYQLEDAAFYYYNSSNSSVMSILYGAKPTGYAGKYEGGSASPTFSSSVEAKRYVKYMEYQDFELISITASIANLLNGGSGSTVYVKAPKETKNAQEGQLWLHYKKASWTPSSGAGGWAFYYYGEGNVSDGINVNGLSPNLNASLDAVTTRIVDGGNDLNLVGEDYTHHITGAPYLADSQMHPSSETVSSTMMGSTFVLDPVYKGDSELFQNDVTVGGKQYPIATNMALEVGVFTKLYYKDAESGDWTKLNVKDGTLLKNAMPKDIATGVYSLREYGDAGVCEFQVYMDRSLPLLSVTLNQGLDEERHIVLDGSITELTPRNLVLNEINTAEADPQAFVAIYSYPSRSLQKVLYAADVAKGYTLSDGNFYLTVGDRSGNVVSYVVRTATDDIEMTVEPNEAKTGVYVRTLNRESNEVLSYEVYLNEQLIDNEFETTKFYRGAGVYRVELADIYGNVEVKTCTFAAPSPDITWYYLNDSGSYSLYDPNKPVRMTLKDDPDSSRTTNVYASTTVRLFFNGVSTGSAEVEFEILDLEPGEYAYNESTGLLTINTMKSWRLRVWYKGQSDNDHTYIFRLDNTAPEISGTFSGTGYHPYVLTDGEEGPVIVTSTFDQLNTDKYKEGDVATLDTLEYVKDGQAVLALKDGAIINGNRIVLNISDPSGIRSVQVTQNGVPLEMAFDKEKGELIINGYGTFVVTVTDELGNVSTFRFVNVEEDISTGSIDGEILSQDIRTYGHDYLNVHTEYEGVTTVLVQYGDGQSDTLEFHYENGILTYGKYFIFTRERRDQDDEEKIVIVKYAEYVQAVGFSIDAKSESTRPNVWYVAVEEKDYVIRVMFDEAGKLTYRVYAVKAEINVEVRVEAGNAHLPNRYMATLSKEAPYVDLLTGGEKVETETTQDYLFITNTLTIDKDTLPESVTLIQVAYSENTEFENYVTVYKDGKWLVDFKGEEFGFYQVIVTNKYNNSVIYVLDKIESFASVVKIYCIDGSTMTYHNNEGLICANSAIDLVIMSDVVRFVVDGQERQGRVEGHSTILSLTRDGHYNVRAIGANGIFEDFEFEIKSDADFRYQESWITGFNEKALLADEGYTNTNCTVVLGDDVVFVDMLVNDDLYVVLYDSISDNKHLDPQVLVDAIGRYGVGKYEVGFRNRYGDLVKKTVYYNNIPSIVLSRTIVTDPSTSQIYDIGLAVSKGFYSNNTLTFSTTSSTYVFTINGQKYSLDEAKTIEFSSGAWGSFSYTITYLDEYGNYVTFEAILLRQDVEFDATAMRTIVVNTTTYTKDDVVITFADGLKATVSVNGETAVDYSSGQMRYADGDYHFVVRDIAGNISTFDITHKSVNHYTLTNGKTGEDVIDGGVVNNATVIFAANDGSKIKYVVRNGELITELTTSTLTLTGHYQLLIEDNIGNQSYEEFTIINNSLATFDYEAPFEYEVTEVWRVKADGSREMTNFRGPKIHLDENGDYIVVVTSTKTTSSFNFSVTIDNSEPAAKLVGVEDGQVTARDVTLTGLKVGDIVKIYKDGELISTTTITLSTEAPKINTGGRYRVTVTNLQGVTIEYNFTRKAVANASGSIFFIVSSVLIVVGIGVGLIYHTKLKTDD